jgi:prepilin-type N-terminal cleavage/methylation domain-containing protein
MFRWNRTRKNKTRMGYTLIEVLVVITIISLLAMLIVPSMLHAKELAREVACASNARNIGVVMQYYAEDHDYRLPIPFDELCARNPYYSWAVALGPYVTENSAQIENTSPMSTSFQPEWVVKAFQCPTLVGLHPSQKNTYMMNNYGYTDPDCFYHGLNLEVVTDPYCRIAVGDGAYSVQSGAGLFQDVFFQAKNLGFYHKRGEVTGTWTDFLGVQFEQTDGWGTLLMVDGHVDSAEPGDITTRYFIEPY